jgi:hypothetical protein
MVNYVGDHIGYTAHASDTNVAGWKRTNEAQFATLHEADKTGLQPVNRYVDNLNAMGIYDDAAVAASDDQATTEAIFTALDASFVATYHGSRAR